MSTFANPPRYSAETADAYVAALLDLLGDRDPYAVLAETPAALRDATGSLDTDALRTPEGPGRWSVHHVVTHLLDSEVVYGYRMRLIVAADRPAIPGYDQEAWAARLRYTDQPLDAVLDAFAALRALHLAWLRALSDDELDRVGLHNERGEESVRHIVRLLAAHDLVHRGQIARITAAVTG